MNERYVDATLEVEVPLGYPATPPSVKLLAEKGLGDARAGDLLKRIEEEGRNMVGDMILGHLCGVAKEEVTSMNEPEGGFCGLDSRRAANRFRRLADRSDALPPPNSANSLSVVGRRRLRCNAGTGVSCCYSDGFWGRGVYSTFDEHRLLTLRCIAALPRLQCVRGMGGDCGPMFRSTAVKEPRDNWKEWFCRFDRMRERTDAIQVGSLRISRVENTKKTRQWTSALDTTTFVQS